MSADDDRQPWDRQPDETAKAFQAFQVYRDMGPHRSIVKVADEMGYKSPRHVKRWSSENDWVARVDKYIDHQDKQRQRKFRQLRDQAYEDLYERLDDVTKALIQAAIKQGDVRAAIDIMDRCGMKPKNEQRIEIGSAEAGEDKLDELLPQVGQDRREDDGDPGAD